MMAQSERLSMQVIVVGCGVSGLSCAIRLAELGFPVTILAKDLPTETTSSVAPAYWDPGQLEGRQLQWGKVAHSEFQRLAAIPGTGISTATRVDFYPAAAAADGLRWWTEVAHAFGLQPPQQVPDNQLPVGYEVGVAQEILQFDSSIYLPHLVARVRQLGCEIQLHAVTDLAELYGEQRLIVHCAGLGARTLAGDETVYPIRGQIVRIRPASIDQIRRAFEGPCARTFVVRRAQDCVLGFTYEPHNDNLSVDLDIAADIVSRGARLEPRLGEVEIIEHRVGLRPGRPEVRLELETITATCAVIHNYGHGSHGYSFSWGCAEEVAELAMRFVRDD